MRELKMLQLYCHYITLLLHFSYETKCKFDTLISKKDSARIVNHLFEIKLQPVVIEIVALIKKFSLALFS